jgi:subtilisin family serine protease
VRISPRLPTRWEDRFGQSARCATLDSAVGAVSGGLGAVHPAGILAGGVLHGLVTMESRARADKSGLVAFDRIPDSERSNRLRDFAEGFAKGALAGALGGFAGPLVGAGVGAAIGPFAWNRRKPLAASGTTTAHQASGVHEAWDMGYKGKGVTIVVMDTGMAPHDDLKNRMLAFHDFSNPGQKAYDPDFHGTFCAGIAAGDGSKSHGEILGVAPEAGLIGLKVDDEEGFDYPNVLKALKWIDENRDRYNIQVVNMSFGLGCGQKLVADAIKPLADKGIIFCTSVGNGGPHPRKLDAFKGSEDLLTAACLDNRGTSRTGDDRIADLSTRPPEGDTRGPDVAVSGTDVTGCDHKGNYRRVVDGGSSFSSAYLAGSMALWKQARPGLTLAEARSVIEQTSVKLEGTPEEWQGAGQLQVAAGLKRLTNAS